VAFQDRSAPMTNTAFLYDKAVPNLVVLRQTATEMRHVATAGCLFLGGVRLGPSCNRQPEDSEPDYQHLLESHHVPLPKSNHNCTSDFPKMYTYTRPIVRLLGIPRPTHRTGANACMRHAMSLEKLSIVVKQLGSGGVTVRQRSVRGAKLRLAMPRRRPRAIIIIDPPNGACAFR